MNEQSQVRDLHLLRDNENPVFTCGGSVTIITCQKTCPNNAMTDCNDFSKNFLKQKILIESVDGQMFKTVSKWWPF